METYCSNCCKIGHSYHQCKMPIISIGIIAFTRDEKTNDLQFLMIRRKDTLGFMDFMRGKYSIYNKEYIVNLLKEMTISEKEKLLTNDFETLWNELWLTNNDKPQFGSGSFRDKNNLTRKEQWCKADETIAHEKYNALICGIMTQNESYTLAELIEESNRFTAWNETEWGFPKGRRNHNENDLGCAIREFVEETGYSQKYLYNIDNIQPFEEIFMGSNYKSYKHKYYLMKFEGNIKDIHPYDKSEVSKIEWKTYQECIDSIRDYNLEKKRVIQQIYNCLVAHKLA